ncbi:MAG: hypothetical protein RLZZ241_1973, partial [Bacteroidota bacterium]
YRGKAGIATSIGHAPAASLINAAAGSRISIAESLTNLVWAPLQDGLKSVSLSANWMWPCNNPGEDARLYEAVEAASDFAIALGINIPTGKDSLSMKQKYPDRDVLAPGTVIISAGGHCSDINQVVEPVFKTEGGPLYYIKLAEGDFELGGTCLAQILNKVGQRVSDIQNPAYFALVFNTIQNLIKTGKIVAGHDISSGGLITALLEGCFATPDLGLNLNLSELGEKDTVKLLFAENAGLLIQAADAGIESVLKAAGVAFHAIGTVVKRPEIQLVNHSETYTFNINALRDIWYTTSYLLDSKQTAGGLAKSRFENYKNQPLSFEFPSNFNGELPKGLKTPGNRPKAAILREKGSNSEREMAHALYLAGFDVKDVHMTDLISGRETLEDIQFIGAVGGFSNSDVLGSAKGWAGAFKYNELANQALRQFFDRKDTLSVGICNGCQLFMELEVIHPEHEIHGKMIHNNSHKHESAFTSVTIGKNNSVMLGNLEGSTLGVWISHGEGKFQLPNPEDRYNIVAKYGYASYPANPNGSDYNTAMLCDTTGRHLVTMPHIERSIFPWNWAHYESGRVDEVSPWLQAFVNARLWIEQINKQD